MPFTNAISPARTPFSRNYWLIGFILVFSAVFIYTFTGTPDMNNWMLENTLTAILLVFLVFTYKKYTFSDLSYLLICLYLCLHVYGSQYTYAENPLGYWLKDKLGWERNHYDRIVHFSFGFLLAYPWREGFLTWGKFPKWVAWLLPIEMTLSISGMYELLEWAVADIFFKAQGPAYLGTQGDIWDAQKDMGLAFFGAILATTIVSGIKKLFKV
jgi:putative membrane protein